MKCIMIGESHATVAFKAQLAAASN